MTRTRLNTFVLVGLGFAASAHATVWSGLGANANWTTGGNWVGNAAPGFNGVGEFTGTPTAQQPNMNGVVVNGMNLNFQSAGWTISDSVGTGALRIDVGLSVSSAGAGVNTVGTRLTSSGTGNVTFNVGTGNTLRITGELAMGQPRILNGPGTMVLDGPNQATIGTGTWTFNSNPTLLLKNRGQVGGTLTSGRLGGSGTAVGYQFQTTTIDGATLAPGGNGTHEPTIGTFTFQSNTTSRHELVFDDQAIFEAEIGTTLGSNDKLELRLSDAGGGNLEIKAGATLNLLGTTIQDGSYTIIQNIDADPIVGTFTNVNFNGSPINPAKFTVTYSTNSVVVNVTGVPEPASLGLFAAGAMGVLRRRLNASRGG